ncbi:DoxX-like family protein [Pedobacter nutrimenti]|uniref:DoxX-like family protein n=1 Tax=Pedobacter nutrimenti TaxID=1241337 RepID=UPI00292F5DCB|nr:DoxX-like family protein [Pedobacter nutrimenti]
MKSKFLEKFRLYVARNPLELMARIGVFGTFLGHGTAALKVNPKWIPLLTSIGFTSKQAVFMMPFIGVMDIIVAIIILIHPVKEALIWAAFWAFLAALSRPVSGEPFVEFIERSANWCLPLVLLMMKYARKPNTIG